MLSGIAHELRNPLAIVSARTQRALDKNNYEKEWTNKTFKSIDTQTKRCASIVNNLLNFARNTATASGFHKIKDILDETLSYVNYQNIFDNITVEKKYKDDLFVYGDRSRFVQIFLNLITNAADAMEGKGELIIAAQQSPKASTLVEIKDNGPGIDEKIKEKIFDPFFTTKDPGKGTGLGLSIVYKIVEESNGKIWLSSKPGNTSFFVELPSKKERLYDSTYSSR
jgi:signal transduction histidine kinase